MLPINKSCILYIFILLFFIGMCFCGLMWSRTSDKLDKKSAELLHANATIMALQRDNDKLSEYNIQKNNQIKKVEEKYKQKLNNIPADSCGDVKPSKELLEYFKKNV